MAASTQSQELVVKKFQPTSTLKMISIVMVVIGVLTFALGLVKDPDRVWPAYLTAFYFVSCLGIGGLFFAVINNMAKAGWSVSIRRLSESMTSFLPVMLIGSLVLMVGLKRLYPWANPEEVAASSAMQVKTSYLNMNFLIVRLLIFGLGMIWFASKIVGNSLKQDQSGDENLTVQNVKYSVIWTLFFAIFFSLFSVDLLMSLLPTWYSTIFGIYCFAGLFQSTMAMLLIIMIYMRRAGYISGYYTEDHMHDVAKYMKAFTIFWAYIAFSQFMLIWYANIPEETEFFLMRAQNGWAGISTALVVFKFIVPFLALLPRAWKRNENHVIAVSCLVLVMQYLDIHWLVFPNFNENNFVLGIYEIGMLVGFLGLFLMMLIRFWSKHSLVAIRDPRMDEALHHHVTY